MIFGKWTHPDGDVTATLHTGVRWECECKIPEIRDVYLDALRKFFPPERIGSYGPSEGWPAAAMLADVKKFFGGEIEILFTPPEGPDEIY